MKLRKSEKGFTLIEILVVITLILIIAGIALPRFAGVTDEGRKAKAKAELKTVQSALESYLLNTTSTVPTATWAALETALEAATPRLVGEMSTFYDPFGATATTNYSVAKSSNSKYYVLSSVGPDKTADITGIGDTGTVAGGPDDDVFVTNGNL
ncbi:MAG: hypothetical protein A3C35_03195 [Omnitrophica bacterium RIFCSPHIGHO2_02_FULL_46_11]|nr:MAG: hypothetical protein A3C35_03195 [Omnitrophica bacterium RIFCSPHIGHO2_02_FULL_46_11]OGW87538.1 MAG: hypothetical protein A3A81_03200 [Omnitrophica bacterium RIFCSPLOWO2_01_FULL_45_10b]